jgi:hypothetical protein
MWVLQKVMGWSAGVFMNPFMLKAIACGALVGSIFISGWVVKGDFDNAKIISLQAAQAKEIVDLKAQEDADRKAVADAVAAKIAAADEAGRMQVSILTAQLQRKRVITQSIQMEISHEEKVNPNPVLPDNELTTNWVRIYNQALRSDSYGPTATSRINDESDRSNLSVSSGFSQWDVLRVHAVNAENYSDCRARLSSLIDFINSQAKGQ